MNKVYVMLDFVWVENFKECPSELKKDYNSFNSHMDNMDKELNEYIIFCIFDSTCLRNYVILLYTF